MSADGGATWELDATLSGAQSEPDKQMVWTDHSDRSPHKDNIYAIWHNAIWVYVARRRASDGAWSEPRQVSRGETGYGLCSDVKTNASGHVYAFWADFFALRIFLSRSLDGGASFSRPTKVARNFHPGFILVPAQSRRGAVVNPSAGAYQRGRKSFVYIAWNDLSGERGCRTAHEEPGANVDSSCKSRVWFTRSTTGGRHWSKPRMINNPPTRNDQFNPWLLVDEATGAIGIIYYDTAGESRTSVNVWYQSSFDDGVTWSAPLKVTTAASDASADSSGYFQFGDYNSFSGIAGTFFPSWTDRRTSGPEQIWMVKIEDKKSGRCRTTDLALTGAGTAETHVAVPAGAGETRLAFWHRPRFASGANGGSLQVSVDGGPALAVPASAILAGAGYGTAKESPEPRFTGVDESAVHTVVDLDAVCDAATGEGTGCAGRSLRLFFSAGDVPAEIADRWLVEEVMQLRS